jgi:sec-independent protein translocase protein TatA
MFGKFGELVIILVIILLLFGAKQLPKLSRALGDSAREIRKGFGNDNAKTANSSSKAHTET